MGQSKLNPPEYFLVLFTLHNMYSSSTYQACMWAWEMITDLIHSSPSAYTLKMQVKKVHWCPPPDGVIKGEFRCSFKTETHQGASGVVLRNAQGQVVAARCNTTWVDS